MFTLFDKLVYLFNKTISSAASNLTDSGTSGAVSPIYDFIDTFGPVLIGLLLGVGVIYCIILGVQYAKAEKGDERDTAKKKAINAAISFGVIIILIVVLYGMRDTFVKLLSD